jgi:hypothetical protein
MPRIAPHVDYYTTPVRAASPQSIGIARALARSFTAGALRGTGAIRYGYPQIGSRNKFQGYANTPQLFTGYSPTKVAGGAFRGARPAIPSTSAPITMLNTPTMRAMATVTNATQLNGASYG